MNIDKSQNLVLYQFESEFKPAAEICVCMEFRNGNGTKLMIWIFAILVIEFAGKETL